jgi:F-type H+-transporting ATPase subunit delta
LAESLKKEVVVEATVDSSLIGGLVVHVGNTVYDASVKNHLEKVRERLHAGI